MLSSVYRSKEIIQLFNGQSIDEPLYISKEKYTQIMDKFGAPAFGDMLLTSVGTIGIPYIVKDFDCFYFKDGNLTWFRNFNNKLYSKYLFYWIQSPQGKGVINNSTIGSSQKALTISMLKGITISLPSLNVQRRIADIISTYDDLIENNQKQIKLLEEAAMRLYKEWFVHLRFPGHETTKIIDGVPEGWTSGKLRDYIEVNPKSISKQYPNENIQYIDISSVNSGRIEQRTSYKFSDAPGRAKRIACDGDTIWGMVRPNLKAYALVLSPEDCDVFSTGFAVLSPIKLPYTFLYCMVTRDDFVSYLVNSTNGTAYPAVKPIHFEEAKVIVPSEFLLRKFHDFANPLFKSIHFLSEQSKLLKQARDKLLPKLMSGEIEV